MVCANTTCMFGTTIKWFPLPKDRKKKISHYLKIFFKGGEKLKPKDETENDNFSKLKSSKIYNYNISKDIYPLKPLKTCENLTLWRKVKENLNIVIVNVYYKSFFM